MIKIYDYYEQYSVGGYWIPQICSNYLCLLEKFFNQFGNWFIQLCQLQCLSVIPYFFSVLLFYKQVLCHTFSSDPSKVLFLLAHPFWNGMIRILEISRYISSYNNDFSAFKVIYGLNNGPNIQTHFHKISLCRINWHSFIW